MFCRVIRYIPRNWQSRWRWLGTFPVKFQTAKEKQIVQRRCTLYVTAHQWLLYYIWFHWVQIYLLISVLLPLIVGYATMFILWLLFRYTMHTCRDVSTSNIYKIVISKFTRGPSSHVTPNIGSNINVHRNPILQFKIK